MSILSLRHHIGLTDHKVNPATIIAVWLVAPVLLWAVIVLLLVGGSW